MFTMTYKFVAPHTHIVWSSICYKTTIKWVFTTSRSCRNGSRYIRKPWTPEVSPSTRSSSSCSPQACLSAASLASSWTTRFPVRIVQCGRSRPLLLCFRPFIILQQTHVLYHFFHVNWMWTADLCYGKRQLCQLSHNRWAQFRHFCLNFRIIAKCYLILGNIFSQFVANFRCWKWPNIKEKSSDPITLNLSHATDT